MWKSNLERHAAQLAQQAANLLQLIAGETKPGRVRSAVAALVGKDERDELTRRAAAREERRNRYLDSLAGQ
jgi:hypothetical protein